MNTDITIIDNKKNELHEAFYEIFQGRSNYQIENFVINAHCTPERRYAQCVLELQNKYYSIKKADISRRKLQQEINNSKCPFTIEEIELELEQLELAIFGALREFDILYKIFQQLPKYNNEQLQQSETKYWIERLSTQAQQDIEAHGTISVGNAEALRQANIIGDYSTRFLQNIKNHTGLIKETMNDILSLQIKQE